MNTFSQRLIAAMDGPPKVTQVALAKACGVSQPTVNDWRSGKSQSMGMEYLFTVARKLGVSPEWLATGKGEMRGQVSELSKESQSLGLDAPTLAAALGYVEKLMAMNGVAFNAVRDADLVAAAYGVEARERAQLPPDNLLSFGEALKKRVAERLAANDKSGTG